MTRRQSTSRRIFSGGISKWIFILPSLILLAFFALPLFALVYRSIEPDFFANTLSRQAFQALKLSLGTSSLSTMITVLLGTPLAYLLARWKFKFKSWLELVIDLPIVLPPSVAGLALLIAFGRRGIFGAYLSERLYAASVA